MFGLNTTHKLFGLDIGSSSIKLMEFSGALLNPRVDAHAWVALPEGAVVADQVHDEGQVARAITQAVQESGTKTKHCAIGVGQGLTGITKVIQLPATLSDDQLEEQIKVDFERHIPHRINAVNWDFQRLGTTSGRESMADVLLVACRREIVVRHEAAVNRAGLACDVIDLTVFALHRAVSKLLLKDSSAGSFAILDLGASVSRLHVFLDGTLQHVRDVDVAGHRLTDGLQESYNLSYAEALAALRAGNLPQGYERAVVAPFEEELRLQLNRSLRSLRTADLELGQLQQVFLCGGCAALPSFAENLAADLGIPVQIANPFNKLPLGGRVAREELRRCGPMLLMAAGLALRGLKRD